MAALSAIRADAQQIGELGAHRRIGVSALVQGSRAV